MFGRQSPFQSPIAAKPLEASGKAASRYIKTNTKNICYFLFIIKKKGLTRKYLQIRALSYKNSCI